MLKKITVLTSFIFFGLQIQAQIPLQYDLNNKYKKALELLEQKKYVAASSIFQEVEKIRYTTSTQVDARLNISEIKINAQYYRALCALELKNEDAEELFLKFIRQHPENAKTKQAYFQVGKSYFQQGKYQDALNWFTKVSSIDLVGEDETEYKFKTAYAYFETKDYANAKPLFGLVKIVRLFIKSKPYIIMLISLISIKTIKLP
jgi:tetratricopeptide (TPR) repeat protein